MNSQTSYFIQFSDLILNLLTIGVQVHILSWFVKKIKD